MKLKRFVLILTVVLVVLALAVAMAACKDNKGEEQTPSSNTPSGDGGNGGNGGNDPSPVDPDLPVTTTVAAPATLTISQVGKATWSGVEDATGYEVEINGEIVYRRFANCDLLSLDTLPKDAHFAVRVRTVAEAGRSAWTEAVSFDYQGSAVVAPQVNGLEGTVLKWRGSNVTFNGIGAPHPVVKVGETSYPLAAGVEAYDLAGVAAKSQVVLYYAADGRYLTDSAEVKFVYDPQGPMLAYAAPARAYMEGDILHFDKVDGANIYYFKDVYNTVTSLSGSELSSLSSDRAGHFLVQQVWAGNTSLDIADSDPVDVTYFTAEQGDGSEAHPFLISEASHLRYIEYYEAMGQAKHYRLVNDIAFPIYTPQEDEDYSNFYNLGSLSGVLDGNGYTLSNIVVYYKDGYSSIFDSITKEGKILNLTIANTAWRTWTNRTNDGIMHEKGGECAILAYTNNGLIQNVKLQSGLVTAVKDGAAGLVAINRGTVKDCKAEADFRVYGANEAGAFVIYNAGTIEHCVNYGSVSGGSSVGGIVGRNAGLVTKCSNRGSVSGDIYTGGIVGYNYNVKDVTGMQYDTTVSYCSNYFGSTVSGFAYTGGIVGRNGSDGYNELGADSYANASVFGCYNQGSVSGIISVGGIAGRNYGYNGSAKAEGAGLYACYNTGDINSKVAGFESGTLYLSVAACYWAETDNPDITAHFWKGSNQSYTDWPGVTMTKTTIGESSFYSVKMPQGFATNEISGVIFCRVNPANHQAEGAVFNKTEDITAISGSDSAVYYIDGNWTNADLVQPCWGAIAGYNNQVYGCYYISGQRVGGTQLSLGDTYGGTADTSGLTVSAMHDIYSSLNEALGGSEIFAVVNNQYPILKWEKDELGSN